MAELLSWTRLSEDAVRAAADEYEATAPLKYHTYKAEYLRQGACVGTNPGNCRLQHLAVDTEATLRSGALTNRRELLRGTEARALGVRTAPHQGNGPLLATQPLELLGGGEAQTFRRFCDLTVRGQPAEHPVDAAARVAPEPAEAYAARLQPRGDIYRSSRIERRVGSGTCARE